MILEACCGSLEDVLKAKDIADRIELNSALSLGGLTPSPMTFLKARQLTTKPIVVMIRPRAGGFNYNENEISLMLEEAKWFLDHHCDGIVFGFLNDKHEINQEACLKMVDLIHSYDKKAIFHRAIDVVNDYEASIKILIECGIDRLLTSGHAPNATLGITKLQAIYPYTKHMEICVGCGVNPSTIDNLKNNLAYDQYHASCKGWFDDITSCQINGVSYDYDINHLKQYDGLNDNILQQLNKNFNK